MSDPSLRIEGIKPPDDRWRKMFTIWKACKEGKVSLPVEVDNYFEGEEPNHNGVIVSLKTAIVDRIDDDDKMIYGSILDIQKLPKDVSLLKITMEF